MKPDINWEPQVMTSWEGREGALWNFVRAVAGRNDIPAEEVERDIEKAIKAVRRGYCDGG